ncbi:MULTISPECIES: hypothetical protein [Enterococcus]|uniref:hypothetical protein n=1 Tax=Enterococcus TaxID=1350 RepID=UPI000789AF67|nr:MULTISPECIES: hypothetical protein [Enterococcus]GKS53955.1 hypothetical protein EMLAB_05700 [Enterococcus mundtii]
MKELKGLEQLSYDVADLMPALGLIQNYISCLQLELKHAETSSDRSLILYSLDQNCGFDNIKDVLVATEEKLSQISNALLDHDVSQEQKILTSLADEVRQQKS